MVHRHLSGTWREHSKTYQRREEGGSPASEDFTVSSIRGPGAILSNTAYHLDPLFSEGIRR